MGAFRTDTEQRNRRLGRFPAIANRSPFEAKANVICWPRVLRLVTKQNRN
jgi:hypothetical protein